MTTDRGPRTQAERAAESRERLLSAAIELFGEKGYDATSTGAIADRAGYVRSMVNTRFGGKEGLLSAMLDDHWATELVAEIDHRPDGRSAAFSVLERYQRYVRTDPSRLRAFLVVTFEAAGPSTIPKQQVVAPLAHLQDSIARALLRGQADGSIRAEFDPAFEAERQIDVALGMAYRWVLDPDGYDFSARLAAWRDELGRFYDGASA